MTVDRYWQNDIQYVNHQSTGISKKDNKNEGRNTKEGKTQVAFGTYQGEVKERKQKGSVSYPYSPHRSQVV